MKKIILKICIFVCILPFYFFLIWNISRIISDLIWLKENFINIETEPLFNYIGCLVSSIALLIFNTILFIMLFRKDGKEIFNSIKSLYKKHKEEKPYKQEKRLADKQAKLEREIAEKQAELNEMKNEQ